MTPCGICGWGIIASRIALAISIGFAALQMMALRLTLADIAQMMGTETTEHFSLVLAWLQ